MENINEVIKQTRLEKGLTQKELGELCGIAESTIRRYELGLLHPKIETVEKIFSALGEQKTVEEINERIRYLRIKSGLTQSEAAERMGTSRQNYAQYERGSCTPKIDSLKKIAVALDVPLQSIVPNLLSEEDKAKICEDYCRYPWMVPQQEVLDIICEGCPLGRDLREEKQE